MNLYVRYASGRDFGGKNVEQYRANVKAGPEGVRVEFDYPYQGRRYQRPNDVGGVWSETATMGGLVIRDPRSIRWLARALHDAAAAVANGSVFEDTSPAFSDVGTPR